MRFSQFYESIKIPGIIKVPEKTYNEMRNWMLSILLKYAVSKNKASIIEKEFKVDLSDFSRYTKNIDLDNLKQLLGRDPDKFTVVLYNPNIKSVSRYKDVDDSTGAYFARQKELVINIKDVDKFEKKENQNSAEYKRFVVKMMDALNHEFQHWAQLNIIRPFIVKDLKKSAKMQKNDEYHLQPREFGPLIKSIAADFIIKVSRDPSLQTDSLAFKKLYQTTVAIIDGDDTANFFKKLKQTSLKKWKKAVKLFDKEIESNKSIISIINKK
jgi:hypothetical protein